MTRFLIVDDDQSVIETLTTLLGASFPSVDFESAKCGYDAMASIKINPPDLVLSDYRMINGDGGTLAHFCQENSINCVVLTGFDTAEIVPYIPTGTLVVSKIEIMKQGKLDALVNNLMGDIS